jgi:tetratricopeptide (TPR) repeat protein
MQSEPAQLVEQAVRLFQAGKALAAEASCREAIALDPRHVDARLMLAAALHAQSRYGEAEEIYRQFTAEQPAEPSHWANLGLMRRLGGRHDAALAAYARALELEPLTADLAYNLGLLHVDRKDYVSAASILARAVELAPEDAEIRFEYANACNLGLDTAKAAEALRDWQSLDGVDVDLAAKIAQLLVNLGEQDVAAPALQFVAERADDSPRAALLLVGILERTNRLDEARVLLDRVAAGPHAGEFGAEITQAEAQLAAREGRHEAAAKLYRQIVARTESFAEQHFQLFPLAKSLDALDRTDEAWETLSQAHGSQVASLEMTAPALLLRGAHVMEITRYGVDRADVAAWSHDGAPAADASPIFIVAFPRSGTTLLELMLDAHPDLRSMDEQPFLQNALDDLMAAGARYPSGLAALTPAQLAEVREGYWRRVRDKVALAPGQRLVDKNPLNLLRLPVIARLFPHSRVVLAVRDPRDVLLSCYLQHFRAPDFALLCRDLPTLALGYRRAFDFWYAQQEILRVPSIELRYESFVADVPGEVRRLADFLGLPWHDALLAPAEHARSKGFISTPSYSQVVQPVNTRSVGRWSRYAAHFEPTREMLEPYLTRWGY